MDKPRWKIWKRLRDYCNKKMTSAWMSGGNCDSCCPACRQWESEGNIIQTIDNDDGSVTRECGNCTLRWQAIFTPAGFIKVD